MDVLPLVAADSTLRVRFDLPDPLGETGRNAEDALKMAKPRFHGDENLQKLGAAWRSASRTRRHDSLLR